MTLAKMIHQAEVEGVSLLLSADGKLRAAGTQDAVNRWLPFIQQHKPEIIQTLHAANDEPKRDEASLARLVVRVCRAYDCTDGEICEAIEAALVDYESAREAFETMAKKIGMPLNDDRHFCFECGELNGSYCMSARRGELPGADRHYEPIKYLPRRCQSFKDSSTAAL